jgi:hypothetical protein
MTELSPLEEFDKLDQVASWMLTIVLAYEKGALDRKTASALARRAQKKIKKHIPNELEKSHKDIIEDLCISLSTIDRAVGSFEKFYLISLKEEIEAIIKTLKDE